LLQNNLIALILTFFLALAWLRLCDFAAHKGWINSQLSRKIIHIGTGPVYVLCWLLFDSSPSSRFLAALVPLAITAQFVLVGTGIIKDPAAVKAMSRTGDRREILRGPLYYGIVFVVLTLIYWKDSPIGIVALMLMCGGDGLADILGRRFGKTKLPWNPGKSWIGSASVLGGGAILSLVMVGIFTLSGIFPGPFWSTILPVLAICLAGTLVETLPVHDIDNITITLAAVLVGLLVL
jgi:phytol kinase